MRGYEGEQKVLFVDLLAKDILDSLPCLPLQISRTAAGLQMEIGQGVKHILELETHEQDCLLGVQTVQANK